MSINISIITRRTRSSVTTIELNATGDGARSVKKQEVNEMKELIH